MLFEAATSIATLGTPAYADAYAYFVRSAFAGRLATTIFSGAIWYPIATNLLIMCYVRPYKHAVVRMLRMHVLRRFVHGTTKVDASGAYHVT